MAKATKNQTLTTTIQTTSKIIKNRFVTTKGTQATDDADLLGVAMHDADENQALAVEVIGVTVVEAAGEVAVGDKVVADAQGLAITGESAFIALTGATQAGELIRVVLR